MRKYFIDNIRWMAVLLLFPFHTSRIYDGFENFYIKGTSIPFLSGFLVFCNPWFMPLLFVIAGISTRYALERRTPKQYVKERFMKLFIPFVFGLLMLVPLQTYYAERFHNGYTGGYLQQYVLFFTKQTDLNGYTGGFTPAHLWFILYLFLISVMALPLILYYRKSKWKIPVEKLTIPKLLPMFLIFLLMAFILDIGGKSLGEFFGLFMLGYLLLSEETVQQRLDKNKWPLIISALVLNAANSIFVVVSGINISNVLFDITMRLISWITILAILGMGRHFLNFENKISRYFSKASFPIYVFHQSGIVLVAYCVFQLTSNTALQILLILSGSFLLTAGCYELCRRIPVTRFLFGIKK